MDSGTYQPIIPNCMPSSYPSGRFSLIALRTALSAARRSAGSAARYWATVEAVMLATIPAAGRGRELYGGRASVWNQTREDGDSVWEAEHVQRASLMRR